MNPALRDLRAGFSQLSRVDGDVQIVGNDALISGNGQLHTLALESFSDPFEIKGSLSGRGHDGDPRQPGDHGQRAAVCQLLGGGLREITGWVQIKNNPVLSDLGLSGLQTVGEWLEVLANTSLPEVDLPALRWVGDNIQNPAVRHLRLPQVSSADVIVEDNVQLPACEAAALFAGMGGHHFQSGNDETASCPPAP